MNSKKSAFDCDLYYFTVSKILGIVILLSNKRTINMTKKSIRYNAFDLACMC